MAFGAFVFYMNLKWCNIVEMILEKLLSELLSVSSFIFKVLHERLAQRQALAQLRVAINQQVGREIMFSF